MAELFAHPQHPVHHRAAGRRCRAPARRSIDGRAAGDPRASVPSLPAQLPDACAFAARCPRADDDCPKVPPLEPVRPAHLAACFHPGEAAWNGR